MFLFNTYMTYGNVNALLMLQHKDYFNIDKKEIGTYTVNLFFYPLPCAILCTIFIGYIFNLYGRLVPILICCLVSSSTLGLTPLTSPNYLYLLLLLCFYSAAVVSLIQVPFVNDYVCSSSRGRAISFRSFGYQGSMMFLFGVLFPLQDGVDLGTAMPIASASIFILSLGFICLIKEPSKIGEQTGEQEVILPKDE